MADELSKSYKAQLIQPQVVNRFMIQTLSSFVKDIFSQIKYHQLDDEYCTLSQAFFVTNSVLKNE